MNHFVKNKKIFILVWTKKAMPVTSPSRSRRIMSMNAKKKTFVSTAEPTCSEKAGSPNVTNFKLNNSILTELQVRKRISWLSNASRNPHLLHNLKRLESWKKLRCIGLFITKTLWDSTTSLRTRLPSTCSSSCATADPSMTWSKGGKDSMKLKSDIMHNSFWMRSNTYISTKSSTEI